VWFVRRLRYILEYTHQSGGRRFLEQRTGCDYPLVVNSGTCGCDSGNGLHSRHRDDGETLGRLSIRGRVWGMVRSPFGGDEFLVGTLRSSEGTGWHSNFLRITAPKQERTSEVLVPNLLSMQPPPAPKLLSTQPLARPGEELSSPTLAGGAVAWITLPRGVRSFDIGSWDSMDDPLLLDTATSVAVSLNRNIVAQTEDSLQIFTFDVLRNRGARNDARTSHVYPLGGKHIVCLLQPDRHLTILELGTLRKLHLNDYTSFLLSLPINQPPSVRASFSRGLVAEFGIPVVMQAWQSGTPLPEWAEGEDEDPHVEWIVARLYPDRHVLWFTPVGTSH
jgi:hypothetical protein